ncbi:MAG: proprotein convertase P-domain-containing protein, partial [Chitinophagales bacterium]
MNKLFTLLLSFSFIFYAQNAYSQGAACAEADPFCSDSGVTFAANSDGTGNGSGPQADTIDPGNNYGCLGTTGNPAWYYLEKVDGGSIVITLTNSNNIDIDFALWGPFTDLAAATANCGSLPAPTDCSFSIDPTETVTVPNGGGAGSVYLLLITNYANLATDIVAEQTGGTGGTDCTIVPTCNPMAGDVTTSSGTNSIYACDGDIYSLTSDDNYTLPLPAGNDPIGLGYAIYNCAPTTDDPATDPCWTGLYWTGEDFSEANDNDNTYEYILFNPSPEAGANGAPTDDNLFFVPITMDDICNPESNPACDNGLGHDVDEDGCFGLGTPIEVTYLNPIAFLPVANCDASNNLTSYQVEVVGGYTDYGGTINATDTGAGSMSQSGNILTFTGVNEGDVVSFNVTNDGNGCTATFTSPPIPTCSQCSCDNCPLDMPDGFEDDFYFEVSGAANNNLGSASQGVCSVNLTFDHEYIGDLEITLTSPDGDVVTLIGDVGLHGSTDGSTWDITFVPNAYTASPDVGFSSTWDNDQNWDENGNYTGSYYPYNGDLEDFNSGAVNGTWTLHVIDDQGADLGNFINFTVQFCDQTNVECTATDCLADIGTTTAVLGGGSQSQNNGAAANQYILCPNDAVNITTSDYILPGAGCAACESEIIYHFFSDVPLPGSVTAPPNNPSLDPSWIGYYSEDFLDGNNFFGGVNDGGATTLLDPTTNTIYIVAVTGDDGDDDGTSEVFHDQDEDECYEFSETIMITYLNPIEFDYTVNCNPNTGLGSVDVTITGGYPEFFGGSYQIINTQDGTVAGSVPYNAGSNNATATISNLSNGDDFGFLVGGANADGNGCFATFIGAEFVCQPATCSQTQTIAIPDDGNVNTYADAANGEIDLSGAGIPFGATLESVCLLVDHTWVGDLVVELYYAGTIVTLVANTEGNTNNNTENFGNPTTGQELCFTDGSTDMQYFTQANLDNYYNGQSGGTYWEPSSLIGDALSDLNFPNMNGIWYLDIWDIAGDDTGNLLSWSLTFSDGPCVESCAAEAGTIATTVTGNSTNDYVLCIDDELDLASNQDYTNPPAGCYECFPGMVYAIFTCPPTDPNPSNDPCFSGHAFSDFNGTGFYTTVNDDGIGSNSFDQIATPPTLPTNNTLYFVPFVVDAWNILSNSNIFGFDFNGDECIDIGADIIEITYLEPIEITENSDCNGLEILIDGGYPEFFADTYTINITSPASAVVSNLSPIHGETITISGLTDGQTVLGTITDGNGCSFPINEPYNYNSPQVTIGLNSGDVCVDGQSILTLDPNATGGTVPYSYLWSNNSPNPTIDVNTAGTYSVTVTDSNGCSTTDETTIGSLPVPDIDPIPNQIVCGTSFDLSTVVTGTNLGGVTYTYYLDDGSSGDSNTPGQPDTSAIISSNVSADGIYWVVADLNGCKDQESIIVDLETLNASATALAPFCEGGVDGAIDVTVTGGYIPYTYVWSDGLFGIEDPSAPTGGPYTVTITDINGCSTTTNVSVPATPPFTVSGTPTSANCTTGTLGSISLNINGGEIGPNSDYLYNWEETTQTTVGNGTGIAISDLNAGEYNITVSDDNNCTATTAVTITTIGTLDITGNITDVTCEDGNDGTIDITIANDVCNEYNWNGPNSFTSTDEDLTNLEAGTYNVTLTNTCTGCIGTESFVVNDGLNSTGNYDAQHCSGDGTTFNIGTDTYDEANPTGTTTLTNAAGCDSVVTVTLT